MAFVRCYTGTDGQSHFEDQDLLPPDMERSIEQATSSITFTRSPNGRFSDWHNAPRRQYAIFLFGGQMEVVIGDGTTRQFGPGGRRPVRGPHGARAHQPERRWGPPDRYRAVSGLAAGYAGRREGGSLCSPCDGLTARDASKLDLQDKAFITPATGQQ